MDNELKNLKDKNIEKLSMLIVDSQNYSMQRETNKIKLQINHNLLKVKNEVKKLEKKLKKYKSNYTFKV